jgi:hypothetical protein
LDRIKTAWERVAPDATFANLSVVQFAAAIADFKRQLGDLDSLKAGMKAGVGVQRATAKAARKLIGRIVSGVLADAAYGPDSALYRAMGYVRASERKSPTASGPENAEAPAAPRQVGLKQRLEMVLSAWNEIAPEGKFAGMTMADFQLAINPYTQARSGVEATRTRIKAEVATKTGAESAARKLARRIVDSVRADAAYGDDSSLYRAMGYRPASERRSPKRAAAGEAAVSPSGPSAATGAGVAASAPK